MRVLFLITGLGVGGAERQVVGLADVLDTMGVAVTIVCLNDDIGMRPARPGVPVVHLGVSKSLPGALRAVMKLRLLIKEFSPDVVHSHLVHANLLARVARLMVPMPALVTSAHNSNEEGWWRMLAYRLTDRMADISTNVSAEAVEAFEAWHAVRPGRMRVMHNGIDVRQFRFDPMERVRVRRLLNVPDEMRLLLAVGRLEPPKDYHNLLSAFAALRTQRARPVRLAIAGKGSLRPALERHSASLGLGPSDVLFLGVRDDIPSLMSACDIFVLSSAWEGFGLVVAEAMACTRVVVATDSGGVREVLGDAGFLVPPRDPVQLANSLSEALNLGVGEQARMGEVARKRVEDLYSLDAVAHRWLELYARLDRGTASDAVS